MVKNLLANVGDLGSTPGSGRSPGESNGYPLWYSCLRNSMDRGACQAILHEVAKSWTEQLTLNFTHTHTHTHIYMITSSIYYA